MGILDKHASMAAGGNMPTLMVLGDYQFSINTLVFQEWARTSEWNWPVQTRMGQWDVLQFTGPSNDKLELPGVLYPKWKGDIASLDTLRSMASAGKPYQLMDSKGHVQGRWVIERLEEKQTFYDVDGTPKKIEFTLSLKLYAKDSDLDNGRSILSQASSAMSSAKGTNTSAVSSFSSMAKTIKNDAATALDALQSAAKQVKTVVSPVLSGVASVVGAVNRSIAVVHDVRNAAANIEQQVKSVGNVTAALSGAKTLLDKAGALSIHARSAMAVIGNVSEVVGPLPAEANAAMSTAHIATANTTALLNNTKSAARSFINKYSS